MSEFPIYHANPLADRAAGLRQCMFWNWSRGGADWEWCSRQKEPSEVYCKFHIQLKAEGKF